MTSSSTLSIPQVKTMHPMGWYMQYKKDPLGFLMEQNRLHGDFYQARFLNRKPIFANRPAIIDAIFNSQPPATKGASLKRNSDFLGDGLFLSEGELWFRERKTAQAYFTTGYLARYAQMIDEVVEEKVSSWKVGPCELQKHMYGLTVEIVGHTMFSNKSIDPINLGDIFREIADHTVASFTSPWRMFSRRPSDGYLHAIAKCNAVADEIIADFSPEDESSYLACLMGRLQAGQIEKSLVRDHIVNFVFGGHETTALASSFAFHLLAQNPDIQRRLREEVTGRGMVDLAAIEELPLLRGTILETLRLYPPVWNHTRRLTAPLQVGDVVLPAKSSVAMVAYVVHRNPVYFPEPEKFSPERWTPAFEKSLPKGAYFAFSMGPRVCIGQRFAMIELGIILASVIKRFTVSPQNNQKLEVVPTITLRPKHAIQVSLT